jgi:hypothetical protein
MMAKPSYKAPELERFLETLTNRKEAITGDRCVNPPIGCAGPATEFTDELSRKEFAISGLCQKCQDVVFKEEPCD